MNAGQNVTSHAFRSDKQIFTEFYNDQNDLFASFSDFCGWYICVRARVFALILLTFTHRARESLESDGFNSFFLFSNISPTDMYK